MLVDTNTQSNKADVQRRGLVQQAEYFSQTDTECMGFVGSLRGFLQQDYDCALVLRTCFLVSRFTFGVIKHLLLFYISTIRGPKKNEKGHIRVLHPLCYDLRRKLRVNYAGK